MENQQITFAVNTREYSLTPMKPKDALRFVPKAIAVVANALNGSSLIHQFNPELLQTPQAAAALFPEIVRCLAKLDAADVTNLIESVFKSEIRNEAGEDLSNPKIFDSHFTKYRSDLFQVGLWVIFHNIGSHIVENFGDLLTPNSERGKLSVVNNG